MGAGLMGSGCTAVIETLFGLRPMTEGQVVDLVDMEAGADAAALPAPDAERFMQALVLLGVRPADHYAHSRDHVEEMLALARKLAAKGVAYEKLREMDDVNAEMEQVDVAIVVGANDVVNPVAITDPKSPIAGMPIIDVSRARNVIMIKRSLSPGFAGIPNPLFAAPNCQMFFSDGKKAINDIIQAVKEAD